MSIRARLFTVLLLATAAVWMSACAWIYTSTKARLERVLDARLIESARMVGSLVGDRTVEIELTAQPSIALEPSPLETGIVSTPSYDRQLACQIWSVSGRLLNKSDSAPAASLSDHEEGFQNTVIHGAEWRVYAVVRPELGVRVLVGDSVQVRDRLVGDVIKGLLYPAILIMPLMVALIWLSVAKGLAPLQRLTRGLAARDATELHPFASEGAPSELRPMMSALNSLLARVQSARERERDFTTYAAHELKTPLAGLKAQAQVAMRATDPEIQKQALKRIEQSVDRTSRMARQLIDLAAVDAAEDRDEAIQVDVRKVIEEVIEELETLRKSHDVNVIALSCDDKSSGLFKLDLPLFRVTIRNIIENAVQHAPRHSSVECLVDMADDRIHVLVVDEGPGIAVQEQPKVLQRFYRSPGSGSAGSGLGLAIVKMAADRLGGRLEFTKLGRRFAVSLEIGRQN